MAEKSCEDCPWRAKYDAKPSSLLGRLWRWHIGFCPGWKAYIKELDESRREQLKLQYHLK